jgi:hypothetical protein
MSLLSANLPRLIHWRRHAKNGLFPDDAFYSDITAGVNHITAFRRKPIFRRVCKLGQVGGTTGTAWRWHCRTGYGASRFVVLVVLGFDDRVTASDPYVEVALTKSGGATTTLAFHGGATSIPAIDAPEEWMPQLQYADCDGSSIYTGAVTFNNDVRVIAIQVYEDCVPTVDDAVPYHHEWTPAMNSPIYDNRIQRGIEGTGDLIRRNRGLRFDWSPVDGTARTRTANTWINIFDNSSTSPPTSSSPGITVNTTARNTIGATTVPITFAVYASMSSGSGTVSLRNTGGTDVAVATINNATPQWFTATGALAVGSAVKYDVGLASDGSNTLTVYAVSLYEDG